MREEGLKCFSKITCANLSPPSQDDNNRRSAAGSSANRHHASRDFRAFRPRASHDEPVNHVLNAQSHAQPCVSQTCDPDATFTDVESFSPRINVAVSSMTPADTDRFRSLSALAIYSSCLKHRRSCLLLSNDPTAVARQPDGGWHERATSER